MSSAGNRKQHAILEDRATSPSPSQLSHKPAQLWRQEKKDSVLKPRSSSLEESHLYTDISSPNLSSPKVFPTPFLSRRQSSGCPLGDASAFLITLMSLPAVSVRPMPFLPEITYLWTHWDLASEGFFLMAFHLLILMNFSLPSQFSLLHWI